MTVLPTAPPRPARILIVDDDPGTIRLLAKIVQDLGEVRFATNGDDAIALVRRQPPDLILLDVEMPGLDGFQVCRAIKGDPDFTDLPILFVTSHSCNDIETRALSAGAVDFITKPPNPPVVQARVQTHLTLKQRTDALRQLAAVDGLTGIANRRTFDESLATEWRRACRTQTPLALLMVDVDFFKAYNDRYGHQAGDDCLRAVARALAAGARRPGELVARYGGEEFAIVLPASDEHQARELAELLRRQVMALAIPHEASDAAPMVTVSIGIGVQHLNCQSVANEPGRLAPICHLKETCRERGCAALIRAADQALYAAKARGRNRVASLPSDFSTLTITAQ